MVSSLATENQNLSCSYSLCLFTSRLFCFLIYCFSPDVDESEQVECFFPLLSYIHRKSQVSSLVCLLCVVLLTTIMPIEILPK